MFGLKSYRLFFTSIKKSAWSLSLLVTFTVALLACHRSDLGLKYSREPVGSGTFGKPQEDSLSSLLEKYVDSNARVKYASWHQSADDVLALKAVLKAMEQTDTRALAPNQLKSFYLNAYNAMTIDLVISHLDETLGNQNSPLPNERSIRNIQNLDDKVWDHFQWKIGGQMVSLNDVENKLLRPMGDARIHFAIVCASKGCPPISNRAFAADTLDQTLDHLADQFVNSGRNTEFRSARSQIKTSHILEWFAADFDRTFGSVKNFFARYVKTLPKEQISGFSVSYFPYDWTLNEPDPVDLPDPQTGPVGSGTESPPQSSVNN